jgi:hypothetical protein
MGWWTYILFAGAIVVLLNALLLVWLVIKSATTPNDVWVADEQGRRDKR